MKNKIASFRDLEVYQRSYKSAIIVIKNIIPKLPTNEKYDLGDQLRRFVKSIPRLIAEGYSKKHQVRGFHKYLDDALGESNETIVSLSQTRDIYNIEVDLCANLIKEYDIISRQLYRLATVWVSFGRRKNDVIQHPNPNPITILKEDE